MRRMIAGFVPVVLFATGAPAFGHAILISRGVVVAHADRLAVEVEVSAEDFFHYYRIRSDENTVAVADVKAAVERHKAYLLDRFSIRNEAGDRLSGRIVSVKAELPPDERMPFLTLRTIHVTYQVEYSLGKPERFLTFQQRFGDDATVLPSQLVLSVQKAGSEHGRLVQLTNGGNFETVDLNGAGSAKTEEGSGSTSKPSIVEPELAMGSDRFREVYGFVRRDGEWFTVDVYLPALLMSTFVSMGRSHPDFFEGDDIRKVEQGVREYLSVHPAIRLDAASRSACGKFDVERVDLLPPRAVCIDQRGAKPARVGAWSARVAIRLRARCGNPRTLEWLLFNASLMNATVYLVGDGGAATENYLLPGDALIQLDPAPKRE